MLTMHATTASAPPPGALLAALSAGEDAAYEQLVRTHAGRMLAVARRILRNEEDARDAVQEAFVQAFRGAASFRADAKLSTWLHRITVNAALMKLRAAGRRPEVLADGLLPEFDADGHHRAPLVPLPLDPAEALERASLRARVRAAIDRLPAPYRAVLVLRDLEELTTAEAAAALDLSEEAVKTRLHRGRQALAALLRAELADEAAS